MYNVILKKSAAKALEHLDKTLNRRIIKKIETLGINPRPPGCVKLSGEYDRWRIRIGDYRVVYSIDDAIFIVSIERIGHRREVYD